MPKPATTGNLVRRTALKYLLGMEITVGLIGGTVAIILVLFVSNPRIADASGIGALLLTGLIELALVQWRLSFYPRQYSMTQDEYDALKAESKLEVGALYGIGEISEDQS